MFCITKTRILLVALVGVIDEVKLVSTYEADEVVLAMVDVVV
jgi:hypothetical protein